MMHETTHKDSRVVTKMKQFGHVLITGYVWGKWTRPPRHRRLICCLYLKDLVFFVGLLGFVVLKSEMMCIKSIGQKNGGCEKLDPRLCLGRVQKATRKCLDQPLMKYFCGLQRVVYCINKRYLNIISISHVVEQGRSDGKWDTRTKLSRTRIIMSWQCYNPSLERSFCMGKM